MKALVLTFALAACGGAAAPVEAPSAPPSTVEARAGWDAACPVGATYQLRVIGDAVAVSCVRSDGRRDGHFTLYWADGTIAVDGAYDGGARAGTWTVWNPTVGRDPATLTTVTYRDDAPVDAEAAAEVWWTDDAACPEGGVLTRERFDERTFLTCKVDGVAHGPTAEFYDNGHHQAVGAYRDGEQDGRWIGWHEENGAKYGEAFFDAGVDVGRWRYWDETGALIRTEVYEDGELKETIEP